MWLFPGPGAAPGSPVAGEQWALLHSPEWLGGSMWDANGKRARGDFYFFFSPFFSKSMHHCVYTLSSVMQPDTHSYLHTPIAPFTFYPSIFSSSFSFLFLSFFFFWWNCSFRLCNTWICQVLQAFCAQPLSSVLSCVGCSRAVTWGLRPLFAGQGLYVFLLSALRCSASQRYLCVF